MKFGDEYSNDIKLYFERSEYSHFKMVSFHSHDKHELYFLERGSTKYFIGSNIYLLNSGDFIFVPAGEYHQTDIDENSKRERVLLVFDNTFVGTRYLKYIKELSVNKLVHIPDNMLDEFKLLLQKIETESKQKAKDYVEMQKNYLRQLLILISRCRIKEHEEVLTDNDILIQHTASYISLHCNDNLSLESLSSKYSISPCHLSKLFKKITGVGLNEYITIARISKAQELLETADLSVTQIAHQCGFNDSNYFTQVFKKINGVTPKKYSMQFGIKKLP